MHTTSIMSAARAKVQAVPWALPLIGTMPINRQYQILGTLGGLCLVAAALFFFASIRETSNNAVYLTTATEMQMLSQRLAKGAQQAVVGNISGFEQLQQGRDKFGADLKNLIYGSANVPAAIELAQVDLDEINQSWAAMEQKASLILSQKTDLVNLGKNVLAINYNNPRLLELAQEVESTLNTNNAPVRAVRVAGRQVMLTQKLAKNANALLSGELVDPEVAFLLAKDTNTFRDNLLGLINGSEQLHIAPAKDQESLDRLKDLQDAFKEFEGSVTSILQNQQKLIQAKQAGQSIFVGSEKLLALLQNLTDRFQAEAEKQGKLIAAILSAVLMLIFLALMGFASLFDASRRVLELKRADEALQKAHDELEKRVQERTAELKAAHARINHILISSPAVLYSFEASGAAPTFISENLREVFGYEPSEYLEDRNFVPDRVHPDDAAHVKGDLSHLFKEGHLTNEYRFRRKDGSYCWVSDELKVIHDDAGKPIEVVGSWSDITKRKLAEEALNQLGRMKRFFSPAVADLILSGNADDPLKTHRREVVVVFLDLRGFTAFSESADPEEVMGVLAEYHAVMGELITKYAGTLERFAGDGIMIFFNDPVLIPNPAAQAVSMALEMQQRFKGLAAAWARRGYDLSMGIGIAQGFATIGAIGFEGRRDYGAIGNVTNLAARLCGEAKGGQILVSQRVEGALGEVAKSQPIGEISLKGLHKPVKTFEIRWNV